MNLNQDIKNAVAAAIRDGKTEFHHDGFFFFAEFTSDDESHCDRDETHFTPAEYSTRTTYTVNQIAMFKNKEAEEPIGEFDSQELYELENDLNSDGWL